MNQDFHKLKIAAVETETKTAKSIRFDVPVELEATFQWQPGQHVTLRFRLNGEEVRRSYSISSSPFGQGDLRVTVKRVKGGLVSNHINDHLKPGDQVDVMSPFGGFYLDPAPKARRTYYFFGAGSGVTPLFAMAQSVLMGEPYSTAYLLYGNKNAKSIIFRDALSELQAEAKERLSVHHVLSAPSMWSSFDYWRRGKIDAEAIAAFIDENPPYAQDTQYYVCGPSSMNADVRSALMGLDVPQERIHCESYGGAVPLDDSINGVAASAKVEIAGAVQNIAISAGQTVLEAVRAAGFRPPFSCESGVCGACRAHLSGGTVHMRARMALDDQDVAQGGILTCQSLPTSGQIELSYDK
ncbi:MAG: FAD-binding oxidoreductase [Geminicoccales bacterium]